MHSKFSEPFVSQPLAECERDMRGLAAICGALGVPDYTDMLMALAHFAAVEKGQIKCSGAECGHSHLAAHCLETLESLSNARNH